MLFINKSYIEKYESNINYLYQGRTRNKASMKHIDTCVINYPLILINNLTESRKMHRK